MFIRQIYRIALANYVISNYKKNFTTTAHQLDVEGDGDYRDELMSVIDAGDTNIFLCTSIKDLPEILLQAQEVGMITEDYHFIISSLDMHTLDLEQFQYGEVVISGLRMIMTNNPMVEKVMSYFTTQHLKHASENDVFFLESFLPDKLLLQHALIYDAGKQ